MKKVFLFFVSVLAVSCVAQQHESNILNVVPYPQEVSVSEGVFNTKGMPVTYDEALDDASVNVIRQFAQKLSVVSGVENVLEAGVADKGFVFVYNDSIPAEAYTLDVTPEVVRVEASGLRGFNYAIQTIKQLLPVEIYGDKKASRVSWTIQAVSVKDSPRFSYRGMHFDEVRHFFGIEQVKKYLDIMEVHKLNKLHWHITDDQGWRIEIKKYPLLTEIGSIRKGTCIKKDYNSHDGIPYGEGMWYTQDQIREVVAYAASKGIDVIPEIDLPGHMIAALSAYPELGCTGGPYEVWTRWGVSDDLLCAGNEKVYEFLEGILDEICELFPYEYIHLGGDECPKTRWEQCPKCQAKIKELGLKDKNGFNAEHYLQSYVLARMEKYLEGKGRRVIGWDEILEGELSPDATVMSWRGEQGGLEATRLGHDAIMTPNTYFYLDFYQSADVENEPFGIGGYLPIEICYSYEPFPASMTEEQKSHILGVQANLWTEYIATPEHLFYMLLPRLSALSEVQWCAADRKDWSRFHRAVGRMCSIYDIMGYNYATHVLQVSGSVERDVENGCAVVRLSSQEGTDVRYTLDGTFPGKKSSVYTEPLKISESCVLRAVALRDGLKPIEFARRFDFHKAIGKNVTMTTPHRNYAAAAPYGFVDGIRGTSSFKSGDWIGWHKTPVDILVDMGETEPYSNVTVGMLSENGSHIFYPSKISISVSEDGANYTVVAENEYEPNPYGSPDSLNDFVFEIPQTSARYLKISLLPLQEMPQWHEAAGQSAFIFVDEVIVK